MQVNRLLVALVVLGASFPHAFCPTPAAAQQAPAVAPAAPSPCTGSINVVRISDIKPGMMQKFLDAVAAQQAWYKQAGTPDQISVMRIMERNPDTRAYAFSETQAITTHIEPVTRTKGPAHDAGYDAFVAMYSASSTIKTQYTACIAP